MARLPKVKHVLGIGVRAGLKRFGYELQPEQPPIIDPDPFPVDAWTDEAYGEWIKAHQVTDEELARQRAASSEFAIQPTFSFVVPLFHTPLDYLNDVAESVLAQSYGRFELVLVNATPEDEALTSAVDALASSDERIVIVPLSKNYGISLNSDYGVTASSGDFVCFLDHDDFIEPDLLFEYVSAINANPSIGLLYCDEDIVEACVEEPASDDADEPKDGEGEHEEGKEEEDVVVAVQHRAWHFKNPLFKPDYSPEHLLCKNYVMHLLTVRREIYALMPVVTADYDGSQDYNLTLLASSSGCDVHHVARVLYHWRVGPNSTASNPGSKPYERTSNRWAIQSHIARNGFRATVVASGIPFIHNLWFKPGNAVCVSVIVHADGDDAQTRTLIKLFEQGNSYGNYEIVVVGVRASELVSGVRNARAVDDASLSLIRAWNLGAQAAQGEYLLFMPPGSMFMTAEPLEQLLGLSSIKGVGAVAPKSLYGMSENKCFGIAITPERVMPMYRGYDDDFPGYECNLRAFQNPSAVSYEGMMTPRALFMGLGGFDEDFNSVIAAADYCIRMGETGFRCVQTPTVKLLTKESCPFPRYDYSTSTDDYPEADQKLFYAKWPSWRESGDPHFNVNLDQTSGYQQIPHE
ncbi:MAG: glycosyltransferase [Eggerthellaceae bacterium]|nr:glycosyltransferase [Eggerthellaceae bacterium]